MSYVSSYSHCVFSTRGDRRSLITTQLRESLPDFSIAHWDHEPAGERIPRKFRAVHKFGGAIRGCPEFVGRFMESPHAKFGAHWDHEPGRVAQVCAAAQRDRNVFDAPLGAARRRDWFRPASCVLTGEQVLPAGEICSSWILAGHGGADNRTHKKV